MDHPEQAHNSRSAVVARIYSRQNGSVMTFSVRRITNLISAIAVVFFKPHPMSRRLNQEFVHLALPFIRLGFAVYQRKFPFPARVYMIRAVTFANYLYPNWSPNVSPRRLIFLPAQDLVAVMVLV